MLVSCCCGGFDYKKVEQQRQEGPWVYLYDRFKMFGHSVERNQNGDDDPPMGLGNRNYSRLVGQWFCNLRWNRWRCVFRSSDAESLSQKKLNTILWTQKVVTRNEWTIWSWYLVIIYIHYVMWNKKKNSSTRTVLVSFYKQQSRRLSPKARNKWSPVTFSRINRHSSNPLSTFCNIPIWIVANRR